MDLYYVIYTSEPANVMSDAELQQLLETAREANRLFNITGMLICLPDSYIQIIEGPKPQIEQLYKNIQRDKRHMRVTTLREASIDHRFFPNWAMAFKKSELCSTDNDILNLQDEKVLQLFDLLES